jgi:uncharacterized protein YcnI
MKPFARIPAVLAAVSIGVLSATAPAFAHVTANPGEATAGGYTYHAFRVGHGCEGSPTTKVALGIPDGVVSVKPQEVAGWKIDIIMGPITPYDSHGQAVSEGVKEVLWTGGPLPDNHMQQFGLSMKMPDKPGETIYFPVVQTCQQGVTRWIELPGSGQGEPELPAAAVKLLAEAAEDAAPGDPAKAGTTSDAPAITQTGQAKDDDSNTLSMAALVIGSAGVLIGGVSFFRKRG